MSLFRPLIVFALLTLTVGACGGGDQPTGQTTAQATSGASGQTATTSTVEPGATQAVGGAGGNSIAYSISGGYEASGEAPLIPAMSFFDSGVWTMTFGSDEGSTLLILGLDPATPSINFTDGTAAIAGDSSTCAFNVTHQGANGASGSFECSDVAVVDSGVLTQASDFSGTFDVNT